MRWLAGDVVEVYARYARRVTDDVPNMTVPDVQVAGVRQRRRGICVDELCPHKGRVRIGVEGGRHRRVFRGRCAQRRRIFDLVRLRGAAEVGGGVHRRQRVGQQWQPGALLNLRSTIRRVAVTENWSRGGGANSGHDWRTCGRSPCACGVTDSLRSGYAVIGSGSEPNVLC